MDNEPAQSVIKEKAWWGHVCVVWEYTDKNKENRI